MPPLLPLLIATAPTPLLIPQATTSQTSAQAAVAAPGPPVVIEKSSIDIVVQRDGSAVSTRAVTVRIDREEGVRAASTVPVPVSTSLQRFELIEAYTETPDGRRVPVAPESIITQSPPYAAQMATLSDIQLKVINFPAVTVGARLHATTRITQVTPFFPNAFMFDLATSPTTMVMDGAVRLDMPRDMPLHVDMFGMTAQKPELRGERRLYGWQFRAAGLRLDARSLAPLDQLPRLIATTLDGWGGLARAYQSRATDREQPSSQIKALANDITKGLSDPRARAAALSAWVQRNVRYVNIVLGTGGFVPAPADEVLATRYGDCKGHATILNALLAAAGIDSTSVLINAGATYREPTVAGQVFNHMINYLPQLDVFVDTTNPFTAFGDLPNQDRAKFVVLTRSGETRRTPAYGPEPEGLTSDYTLVVTADGGIDGTSSIVPSGGVRADVRNLATAGRAADPRAIAAGLMRASGSPGVGTVTLPDPDGPDPSIRIGARWHIDDAVATGGTGALKLPYGVALNTIAATVAAGPVPTTATLCNSVRLDERFALTFPANYDILALPSPAKVETSEVRYSSSWTRDGQTVRVTRKYESHFPNRLCAPEVALRSQQAKRQIARDTSAQILYARK